MTSVANRLGSAVLFASLLLLAVIPVTLLFFILNGPGERADWGMYLFLGGAFPILSFLGVGRLRAWAGSLSSFSSLGIIVVSLLVFSWLMAIRPMSLNILPVFLFHSFFLFLNEKQALKSFVQRGQIIPTTALGMLFLLLSWIIALRYGWWLFDLGWSPNLALLLVGVFCCIFYAIEKENEASRATKIISNIVCLSLLFWMSFRTDSLFRDNSYHHWGAICGPADMVREGGWLLWDVPSQYGFLSTLSLAWFPAASTWHSLYFIDGIFSFFAAAFLFSLICQVFRGPFGSLLALWIVIAVMFLLPGWAPGLQGAHLFPSMGAFRFFWCYALLAVVLRHSLTAEKFSARLLVLGNFLWMLGCLWSVESAAYCSVIWLSFYVLVKKSKFLWSLPAVLMLTALGGISLYYFLFLGHFPDWRAFADYALSFSGGFISLPITSDGSAWSLCFLMIAMIFLLLSSFLETRKLPPLLLAATSTLWAISSYFVARSHENNLTTLTPLYCASVFLALFSLEKNIRNSQTRSLGKVLLLPPLVIWMALPLFNTEMLWVRLQGAIVSDRPKLETLLPKRTIVLQSLLDQAKITENDFLVAIDGADNGNLLPVSLEASPSGLFHRPWLPIHPLNLLTPLSPERRKIYLTRFIERAKPEGWTLLSSEMDGKILGRWLSEDFPLLLRKYYEPTETLQSGKWYLIRWKLKNGAIF
jgi:hypothetical protein